MKKIIISFNTYIIIASLTICFLLAGYFIFHQGKKELLAKTEWALQEVEAKDYHNRYFKISHSNFGSLGRKIKGYNITTERGPETIIFKDSIDEQLAGKLADQYVFTSINPIIPNEFNILFKEELAKHGITGKVGVIYRHNNKPQYSDNDSISPKTALRTRIKMLDIKNTVSVQGWVDYSWATLFHNIDSKSFWAIVGAYIFALIVILYRLKKKQSIAEEIENEDENEETENYCRVAGIKLDLDNKALSINKNKCTINNLDFELLLCFLQAPNRYLTREEIAQAFWPKENDANDKINSHISILRKILRDFPEYKLERDKGKGYFLTIPQ